MIGSRAHRSRYSRLYLLASAAVLVAGPFRATVRAQSSASNFAPLKIGSFTMSGSLRTRVESWDWFGEDANGTYTYPATLLRIGLSHVRKRYDWTVEFSAPLLFALPEQPVGAGPAGLGANYFIANDRRRDAAGVFAKQASLTIKDIAGVAGQSIKVGRTEFLDGAEVSPKNETLRALKRDRVAARLLANFGFTHVQRSVDGVQYALDRPATNVTLLAARPTRGVFQVNGWSELNINVLYGAVTRQLEGSGRRAAEWRVFGLGYADRRDDVVKSDNRSLAARQRDRNHVDLGTFGGHYIIATEHRYGTIDGLVWGAGQLGSWGQLAHRAGAVAAEAGWQARLPLAPWIRGGFDYASGDGDPNDARHGTFFQVLPTPRLYARFPFFNLMNSRDAFTELILRPSRGVVARADVHTIRIADGHDLWYQGGGAFQARTFGYIGQPVNGHLGLATLYDASGDVTVTPRLVLSGYYAYASGGSASAFNYPTGNAAVLGYVELLIRF